MWTHRRSGQINQRGEADHRNPYERDRTRVIHAPAFRRLQGKTQVHTISEGDFHRTRLTHSLEVASIGRSIVRNLARYDTNAPISGFLPDDDLITTICLLHDIGHPPFGHGGEAALNYMMRDHGGFEGNGQTLRLLTKLEDCYGPFGLDLTRRVLLGILKYPLPYTRVRALKKPDHQDKPSLDRWIPPKAYFDSEIEEVQWLLSPLSETDQLLFQSLKDTPNELMHGHTAYSSFDCSIMDISDNIAYGVHDLEDAIYLGVINQEQLATETFLELLNDSPLKNQSSRLINQLFSNNPEIRKHAIGELVNYFITSVYVDITHPDFVNPLLKYNVYLSEPAERLLSYLITCIYTHVINAQEARIYEHGGQSVLLSLFEAIYSKPLQLLDEKNRKLYQQASSINVAFRIICDYLAAMTDAFAYQLHNRLFGFSLSR